VVRSWLFIQRSRVRFLALPHFVRILGGERGLLSLLSAMEELRSRNEVTGTVMLTTQHTISAMALTSPTSGDRLVGIVCSRTKPKDFFCLTTVE
jgi:hypothetical protein